MIAKLWARLTLCLPGGHLWSIYDVGRWKVRRCRSCGRMERRAGRWRWWSPLSRWREDNRPRDDRKLDRAARAAKMRKVAR